MKKISKNSIKYIIVIVAIFIIIIIISTWYYFNRDDYFHGGKNIHIKIDKKNKPLVDKSVKCNSKGFPSKNKNGDLYKIYNHYSDMRDFNSNIQKNTNYRLKHHSSKPIGPKNIFIARHAQRTEPDYYLNHNGIYKSTIIPELINAINNEGYPIHAVVTVNPSPVGHSIHVQQTITLSSWLLNIPLYIFGDKYDTKKTATEIYSNNTFNDLNILYVGDHTCAQSLIRYIIKIGEQTKEIKNYKFKNPLGNSKLPYWHKGAYDIMYHIDNKLNLRILNEGAHTCERSTQSITWGKHQKCGSKSIF
jgi:hypothetical protein